MTSISKNFSSTTFKPNSFLMNFFRNKNPPSISPSFRVTNQLIAHLHQLLTLGPSIQPLISPIHHPKEHRKLKRFSNIRKYEWMTFSRNLRITREWKRKWGWKYASKFKDKDSEYNRMTKNKKPFKLSK